MNDLEKTIYLANLLAVARADVKVSPNEESLLMDIQKRIGASKKLLNKAETLVELSDYIPDKVGLLSEQIANLEDMLAMSFTDGSLDQTEKPIILEFAKKIGVTNNQLQAVLAQAKNTITSSSNRACPSCKAVISETANFCPTCGGSLEQSDFESATRIDYEIPSAGIAIEFAESTAVGFVDALNKQKQAPLHASCQRAKKTWYMASWPVDQIENAAQLATDLKGMRNRKLWLEGKETNWDELFGFLWCQEQRKSAYRPVEYCFGTEERRLNIWGCKNTGLDWGTWSNWFTYGEFKTTGLLKNRATFIFDKKRIRHELETNLFRVRFCPYLDLKLVEAVVDVIPREIEIKPNGKWLYKEEYRETPGSIKITENIINGSISYTKEFYAAGVVPRSHNVILELLNMALLKIRSDDQAIRGILEYKGD